MERICWELFETGLMSFSDKHIVWIASYPKSGNTWCRIFLARFLFGIQNINAISIPIYSSKSFLEKESEIDISEMSDRDLHQLRLEVFENYKPLESEVFPVKIHDCFQEKYASMPFLPFNQSKAVIYLVRNPFDLAVSFSRHLGVNIDKTISIMNNEDYQLSIPSKKYRIQLPQLLNTWSNHVQRWLEQNKIPLLLVKYEQLIKQPEKEFARILDFLNLPYTHEQLKDTLMFSSFENLSNQEKTYGFEERSVHSNCFFHTGQSYYFTNYLNENQIKTIFEHHSKMIKYLEYDLEY